MKRCTWEIKLLKRSEEVISLFMSREPNLFEWVLRADAGETVTYLLNFKTTKSQEQVLDFIHKHGTEQLVFNNFAGGTTDAIIRPIMGSKKSAIGFLKELYGKENVLFIVPPEV